MPHCIEDINFCPRSNNFSCIGEEVLNDLDVQIGTYLSVHSVDCVDEKDSCCGLLCYGSVLHAGWWAAMFWRYVLSPSSWLNQPWQWRLILNVGTHLLGCSRVSQLRRPQYDFITLKMSKLLYEKWRFSVEFWWLWRLFSSEMCHMVYICYCFRGICCLHLKIISYLHINLFNSRLVQFTNILK